jgi:streptogramin lyase
MEGSSQGARWTGTGRGHRSFRAGIAIAAVLMIAAGCSSPGSDRRPTSAAPAPSSPAEHTSAPPTAPPTSAPTVASSPLPQGVTDTRIESVNHEVHLFNVAAGAGALWAPDEFGPWMYRVDPSSGAMTEVELNTTPEYPQVRDVRAIVADGSVWVGDGAPAGYLYRVDAETGAVEERLYVDTALALAEGYDSIWVSSFDPYEVLRIDPATNEVTATIKAVGPLSLVNAFGGMWVLEHRANRVAKIDPATNKIVERIPFEVDFPERMVAAFGSLWVSSPSGNELLRIDPKAGKVTDRLTMFAPYEMALGPDGLWVSSEEGLMRVDSNGDVSGPVELGGPVTGVAIDGGKVWTTKVDGDRVFGVDPSAI